MRRVSITDFRANMAKELKNLPFALIRDGKVIAKVCTEVPIVCTGKVIQIKESVQNPKKSVQESMDTFFKPMPKKKHEKNKA